jgi:uncharacterized protein DUF4384
MVRTLLLLLASQPVAAANPPVRVWLGAGPSLAIGDRERVYVQTSTDGNLVVLHARADGSVEVLFPANPGIDPFVRAGTYEIRGPAGGVAFAASGPEGRGMVVAALSPDPIWFDEFVHNGSWDVTTLGNAAADPEALLTDVVQRMLGDGSFNYDVVTYTVVPGPAIIADAAGYTLPLLGVCVECSVIQIDRPFLHRRRRAPVAPPTPPAPAAIAVYSVHRPGVALEPLHTVPVHASPPRPIALATPRRRIPEPAVAPAAVPTTVAVRAIPLVAGGRPAAARATAAARSLLLVRVRHAARSDEVASSSVVTVPARAAAPAVPAAATGGLVPLPAAAPTTVAAPELRPVARPEVRPGAARAATAAPATARTAPSAGVGIRAVGTAGWRH